MKFAIFLAGILFAASTASASTPMVLRSNGAKVAPADITVSDTNWVDLTFSTSDKVYDTATMIGTNQFVVRNSGIHRITITANSEAVSTYVVAQFQVNSDGWVGFCSNTGGASSYAQCIGTEDVNLNAGDTVQFRAASSGPQIGQIRISLSEN